MEYIISHVKNQNRSHYMAMYCHRHKFNSYVITVLLLYQIRIINMDMSRDQTRNDDNCSSNVFAVCNIPFCNTISLCNYMFCEVEWNTQLHHQYVASNTIMHYTYICIFVICASRLIHYSMMQLYNYSGYDNSNTDILKSFI